LWTTKARIRSLPKHRLGIFERIRRSYFDEFARDRKLAIAPIFGGLRARRIECVKLVLVATGSGCLGRQDDWGLDSKS
jgi:hypothetical protein